ncbi:MAG: hypothetical protein MJ070_09360 [Lachnospiraceae bacterium]|nr:hypothetical protein [Lachnospiraceae bacterium]
MKETISLEGTPFSDRLFVPHDFAVREVRCTPEELTFFFADDETRDLFPERKSLVIRFHLHDDTVLWYREKKKRYPWQKHGYVDYDEKKVPDLCHAKLEYVDHFFSCRSVVIGLWAPFGALWCMAGADRVEYEWREEKT